MSRKPGRKPVFSEQDVIDAAFAIGIDKFTLSQVAERLGVAAAALYRIFDSRDAIVSAAIQHAVAGIPEPDTTLGWRELLTSLSEVYWQLMEDYPGLERVVYSEPTAVNYFADFYQSWIDPLIETGKTPGQARFAAELIGSITVNTHLTAKIRQEQSTAAPGVASLAQPEVDSTLGQTGSNERPSSLALRIEFIITALEQDWPELATT